VEASQQAWRPNNPWHELYTDIKRRHGKSNPRQGRRRAQGPDRRLAHPLLPAAVQAQRTTRDRPCPGKLSIRLAT
jgi:hypothetical protein